MSVLHAAWCHPQGRLCLWGEDGLRWGSRAEVAPSEHPYAASEAMLQGWLGPLLTRAASVERLGLWLPSGAGGPQPSPQLRAAVSVVGLDGPAEGFLGGLEAWEVPCVALAPLEALDVLLGEPSHPASFLLGPSARVAQEVARLALALVQAGSVTPSLEVKEWRCEARWKPAWSPAALDRLEGLAQAMPPLMRAGCLLSSGEEVGAVLGALVHGRAAALAMVEAWVAALGGALAARAVPLPGARKGRPLPAVYAVEQWLRALAGAPSDVVADADAAPSLAQQVERWERGAFPEGPAPSLVLRIEEPADEERWWVAFMLQDPDDPSLLIQARDVWEGSALPLTSRGGRLDLRRPLLDGLRKVATLWPEAVQDATQDEKNRGSGGDSPPKKNTPEKNTPEKNISPPNPCGVEVSPEAAERLLRQAEALRELGVSLIVPSWLRESRLRVSVRASGSRVGVDRVKGQSKVGRDQLEAFRWDVSLEGGEALTREELQRIANLKAPLVRLRGHWLRLTPEQIGKAARFLKDRKSREAADVFWAMRALAGVAAGPGGVEVDDVRFPPAWEPLLKGSSACAPAEEAPGFGGVLRPYQRAGVGWIRFLENLGLGACLADDMGLGKTVQVLALLHREKAERQAEALAALVAAESAGGGEEGDGASGEHGPPDPPLVGGVGGAEAEVTEAGVGLELAADAEEEVADAAAGGAADAEGDAASEGESDAASEGEGDAASEGEDDAASEGEGDAAPEDKAPPEDPMAAEIAAALAAMSAEEAALFGREARATLLVCPASVLVNWWRETRRFAPGLVVHLHHGNKRLSRKALRRIAERVDLVLTTYGTVARDAGTLTPILWRRVVLDEAQHIKNPGTRQSRAVYHLSTARRLALTGTPVENRLGELWAISRFLNPGLLGSLSEFRRRFARPIERAKDVEQAARLKALCGPFMLRRLKKDPDIQLDLPEKLEIKEWCALTPEQVTLYQATLKTAFEAIEGTDGVKRKGNVLAALTRLKQICNHPALFLGDGSALEGRSGKLARLEELLTAVLAAGEKALVFTQYKGFGELLAPWLAERLGCGVLFLHGELEAWSRGRLVERFQSPEGPPIMLLSLRAGGVGLNLTAASHVIHMDRWWNPAVEDQASDRAYRIGQTREVQVRKLICAGTLEESIDAVIESKQALADQVLGVGEGALTELTTERLRAMLSLSAPGEERA